MKDGARLLRVMDGVRELYESKPVKLWMDEDRRLFVRAYNEDGCNSVAIDLFDILNWCMRTVNELVDVGTRNRDDPARD